MCRLYSWRLNLAWPTNIASADIMTGNKSHLDQGIVFIFRNLNHKLILLLRDLIGPTIGWKKCCVTRMDPYGSLLFFVMVMSSHYLTVYDYWDRLRHNSVIMGQFSPKYSQQTHHDQYSSFVIVILVSSSCYISQCYMYNGTSLHYISQRITRWCVFHLYLCRDDINKTPFPYKGGLTVDIFDCL